MTGANGVDLIVSRIKAVYATWVKGTPVEKMRADWEKMFPEGAAIPAVPVVADGVPAEWLLGERYPDGDVILFLHGGGFRLGSPLTHRDLAYRVGVAAECRVLTIDYRLVPEHRFPAPVDDSFSAYRWLLNQGVPATRIALAGDSAGGGLCFSVMFKAREAGLPLPAAAYIMSPWTDMETAGDSYATKADRDPIHQRQMMSIMAKIYLGDMGLARDPLASPIYGDLSGMPPFLAQVGEREVILDDARILVERARSAGGVAELQVWDGMIHVFQQYAPELQEARDAIRQGGVFLRRHLDRSV